MEADTDRVKGKVALVTGGAAGIGRSACLLLAREGASVAILDSDGTGGDALAGEIARGGGAAAYWHLDVSLEPEVKEVFAKVKDRFGRIDVLVNNAGIEGVNKPTHEVTEEEWDRLMAVNVKGVFFCTKHVISYMKKSGGGSIINLSSIYGLVGAPDVPPYHASKGAVRLMTKTDALLYAADHIRVNSVHPGYIWTPMVERVGRQNPEGLDAFRKAVGQLHPLGHVGEPDDVGWGIVYLASDEANFVTGSELVIDGGYTAR
jgi:NAD(P)-dependent dehydrogenase (short-subunit alcohol dehydrogenase family)